jgi:hypothetical protein
MSYTAVAATALFARFLLFCTIFTFAYFCCLSLNGSFKDFKALFSFIVSNLSVYKRCFLVSRRLESVLFTI